ncbi:hypothetical protein [Sinomonas atrocyanea]|jgi:hypothetical protein|uniref:hypothetical protein n=1 Tax=Sinomonas atrocyanea TaxID=37927 RepID=UPI00285A71C8|nr:hypothetical protein [Sinomonas atrocyanea]MDR6621000.1 hypothetical protein [Sinomonas atrocyanea]
MSTMSEDPRGQEQQGPSVSTIVWGAVVVVVAALIVAGRLGWFSLDPSVAAVVVLLVAGLGLVAGGVITAARRRGPTGEAPHDAAGHSAAPDA